MRRVTIHILAAALPILCGAFGVARADDQPTSIYSDPRYAPPAQNDGDAPRQSIYEKVQIGQPLDKRVNTTQQDFDGQQKKFDDSVATLNQAREDAARRLIADPHIAPLEQRLEEAKGRYDDEIDDALSVMSYYDEYQELIAAADKAGQQLDFVARNSPNDKDSIAKAQHHFDDAHKAVEDYEDDTLDNDSYVQADRKAFISARNAQDRAMDNAIANDLAVKSAQAAADEQKQALDALAADLKLQNQQNAVAQAPRDQYGQPGQPDQAQGGQYAPPADQYDAQQPGAGSAAGGV